MRRCLVGFFSSCLSLVAVAEPYVYVVGKFQLQGTSYAQAAFLGSKKMKDYAACEEELKKGRRGQWDKVYHVLRPVRGASYTADYRCAMSDQQFSHWRGAGGRMRYVYLVDVAGDQLVATEHSALGKCTKALREAKAKLSSFAFCGQSSQQVLETKK
ncbi:hypothetical protein H0A36_10670 [Endozoicomonas sp. SM1973]|uniref:Uncharacterized protein n=1 Tax=Spartinivicinus marinus TaxID=2994442 RepID=A0A853HZ58_9GAMM|nr:hypothetical protein [Spartinivicinus marinus]MCX4024881.1 hypothetical protein [Spartinivicinus marinus]NYZ66473.1 hypothetical protein [Spartinivicinus marinus]